MIDINISCMVYAQSCTDVACVLCIISELRAHAVRLATDEAWRQALLDNMTAFKQQRLGRVSEMMHSTFNRVFESVARPKANHCPSLPIAD